MRSSFIFVTIVTCVIACGPSNAQDSPAPNCFLRTKNGSMSAEKTRSLLSWNKRGRIDFLEQCDLGAAGEGSRVLWAPDSRRSCIL